MSLDYDPAVNIRHWPTPMSRYGKNPYGENLYRIVAAASVKHLVGGEWPDGSRCYRWATRYPGVKTFWILERWGMPAMSKREWDDMRDPFSGWPILGPYPSRGEYQLAFEFDQGVQADNLDQLIALLERKRLRSYQDHRDAVMRDYDAEGREMRSAADAEIRDAVTAFGMAPVSSRMVSRGSKTRADLKTAEELGLPVPRLNRLRNPKDLRGLDMTSTLLAGA